MLATGETRSVREFVELALRRSRTQHRMARQGRRGNRRRQEIRQDAGPHRSRYFRPTEVDLLIGDASKAHKKLGWKPKTSFAELVKQMVAGDLAIARREVANGKHAV